MVRVRENALVVVGFESSDAETRLLNDLFKNYTREARPTIDDNDTVNVTFGFTVSQLVDIHEKNQILMISAFIRQVWTNPLLAWNAADYNNITTINVYPTKVWLPDIVLYNNADEDKSFGGNLDRLNTRVILESSGKSKWLAPVILKSKCAINVKFFPFDEQRCIMKFGSWTYDKARLNLLPEDPEADLTKYLPNAEWLMVGIPAKRNEVKYICCPELYPDVTYTVIVKRRSLFYLCNLIFPMTMIGMLTMLSFLLPAESGERISLAITLLLAMTVFMLVVADIIPATSETIPLVSVFFSAAMVEMVLMIIVLCYIMRLYHKEPGDPPMALWMRRYVLEWLSYKLGVRKKESNGQQGTEEYVQMLPFQRKGSMSEGSGSTKDEDSRDLQVWVRNTTQHKNGNPACQVKTEVTRCKHTFSVSEQRSKNSELDPITRKLELIVDKIKCDDEDDVVKSEWRIVAMTIDQFLLYSFMIMLLVTIAACFSSSPGYVP
eukprot:gene9918-10935_t